MDNNTKRSRGGQLSLKFGDKFGKLTVDHYDKKEKRWACIVTGKQGEDEYN